MRNPQGQATIVGDLQRGDVTVGTRFHRHTEGEIDTFTCEHCNRIVHVPVRADPANIGGMCKQYMGLVCPPCLEKRTCTPWEKQMAIMESRERLIDACRE